MHLLDEEHTEYHQEENKRWGEVDLDRSMKIEEAEICPRRLNVRPFLDFRDEEQHLLDAIEQEHND